MGITTPIETVIRRATQNDLDDIVKINNSEPVWFYPQQKYFFEQFVDLPLFYVAEKNGEIAGFALGMDQSVPYQIGKFTWFTQRYENFTYIDRVIIKEKFRKKGIASRLYKSIFDCAQNPLSACNICINPYNSASISYHQRWGFRQVGEQEVDDEVFGKFVRKGVRGL